MEKILLLFLRKMIYLFYNFYYTENENRIYLDLVHYRFNRSINDIVSKWKKFSFCFLESGYFYSTIFIILRMKIEFIVSLSYIDFIILSIIFHFFSLFLSFYIFHCSTYRMCHIICEIFHFIYLRNIFINIC